MVTRVTARFDDEDLRFLREIRAHAIAHGFDAHFKDALHAALLVARRMPENVRTSVLFLEGVKRRASPSRSG